MLAISANRRLSANNIADQALSDHNLLSTKREMNNVPLANNGSSPIKLPSPAKLAVIQPSFEYDYTQMKENNTRKADRNVKKIIRAGRQ